MLTSAVPSSGCSQLHQMLSDTAAGRSRTPAAGIHRPMLRRARSASKKRILQSSTHSEPPKTPVYSYHCTSHTSCENPLPRISHGHENSPTVYQYSVAIHPAMSKVYARAFGPFFETVWNNMKAIMLSVVEASVAATGPTGVAFHIHHTVEMFHSAKVSAAQPNMRHHERRVWSYDALIHSSGIMAKGSVSPVMPSQPGESRTTERITAANLRNMVCDFYVGKSSQMSADFKIFHTFV